MKLWARELKQQHNNKLQYAWVWFLISQQHGDILVNADASQTDPDRNFFYGYAQARPSFLPQKTGTCNKKFLFH